VVKGAVPGHNNGYLMIERWSEQFITSKVKILAARFS
jgi:hypothetical protein